MLYKSTKSTRNNIHFMVHSTKSQKTTHGKMFLYKTIICYEEQ